jgi:hypothetical protein
MTRRARWSCTTILLMRIVSPPLAASEPVSSRVRPEGERRSGGRYLVAADVAYQLMGEVENPTAGRGRSVNISSRGIPFETDTVLPVGVPVALQIAWAAKLDQHVALTLHADGRTLRSSGNRTAVAISRYEFRTAAPNQLPTTGDVRHSMRCQKPSRRG